MKLETMNDKELTNDKEIRSPGDLGTSYNIRVLARKFIFKKRYKKAPSICIAKEYVQKRTFEYPLKKNCSNLYDTRLLRSYKSNDIKKLRQQENVYTYAN